MKRKFLTVLILFFAFVVLVGLFSYLKVNRTFQNKISFPVLQSVPEDFIVQKTVNVVFSTDKKYKEYLKVALKSALVNKNSDTFYNIYILCIDLSKKEMDEFNKFETDKVKINIVPLKLKMLSNVGNHGVIGRSHVSRADLFKFFIPEIFKDLNRILYLDSDTLILDDLSKIFNYNLENKYIGVVQESYLKDIFQYNCGVILFDINKCIKGKIVQKLVEAKNNDKKHIYVTQPFFHQVLNQDKVKTMPLEFNRFASITQEEFEKNDYKNIYYANDKSIKTLTDVDKRTVVLHFLAYKKPWQYDKIPFAPLWWDYARLVNPKWEVKKRNFIQNNLLALELAIASNCEKKFNTLKGAYKSYREYYNYLSKEDVNK